MAPNAGANQHAETIPTDGINYGTQDKSRFDFKTSIKWRNVVILSIYHLIGIYCIFTYTFWEVKWLILWSIFQHELGGFGTTAGAHRLWSHRSYKATAPFRAFLLWCFYFSGQNKLYEWVRDHRVHHKYVDTDADPHNSKRGFFFSHMGWLLLKKHPDVIEKGKLVDMSDILEDPIIQFGERNFWFISLVLNHLITTLIPVYVWNEDITKAFLVGITARLFGLHRIWCVNSVAHFCGYKPYDKSSTAVENKLVSFIAVGEGWHNYHHVFPWDYSTAELANSLLDNRTTFYLHIFAKLGWIYDLKKPSDQLIRRVMKNKGSGGEIYFGSTRVT